MHKVLNKNVFLVKEHVGIFKAANNVIAVAEVRRRRIWAKPATAC